LFERPKSGERAILVNVEFGSAPDPGESQELRELALSAGAEIADSMDAGRRAPEPRYLIGTGKVDELAERVAELGAELVIFGRDLSPSQERNLEGRLRCRVLDRTGLILDIFAQRARSFEGKLQVELAQLRHISTRLVRGWTHLERQKGGIGLRGPGETQLETDRRLIQGRIRRILARLEKVDSQRELGRRNRLRGEVPTVALVGYTNAGKSTLFNALTEARVHAADQLFATLDPTLRRLELPDATELVLADTVGFVRDLPHELVAAFRSTLKETRDASLILHVIDASDSQRLQRVRQVNEVLEEIGAREVPQLKVYNKIDVLGRQPRLELDDDGDPRGVWLSARTGEGLDLLLEALRLKFRASRARGRLRLAPSEGRQRSVLYDAGAVVDEELAEDGSWRIELDMDATEFARFCAHENIAEDRLEPVGDDRETTIEQRAAS
jgi:GTP-binding protein HflX